MNAAWTQSIGNHPWVVTLGWTLFHFLWQAVVVALLAATVLGALKRRSADARYAAACCGLFAMIAAPVLTFVILLTGVDESRWQAAVASASIAKSQLNSDNPTTKSKEPTAQSRVGDVAVVPQADSRRALTRTQQTPKPAAAGEGWSALFGSFGTKIQAWLPLLVGFWCAGVMLLAARLLFGLTRVRRWRGQATEAGDPNLDSRFQHLLERMQIRRAVALLQSTQTTVPAVIGWLRPAILVPASMFSGLTAAELESLIAHELAHVRRHDYLVNLIQTVIETVLFYHPAVWWLSRVIRAERENCCDDIAVAVCGDRIAFARALARLEEIRCDSGQLAMSAGGSSLLSRIRRVVGQRELNTVGWWPAGLVVLSVMGLLGGGIWLSQASAQGGQHNVADRANNVNSIDSDRQDYPVQKSEVKRTDAKSQLEKLVLPNVTLKNASQGTSVELDMMYSNVLEYTFLPSNVAKKLGAVELGEIDFGDKPPPAPHPFQMIIGPRTNAADTKHQTPIVAPNVHTVTVRELTKPVDKSVTVVPYIDDTWVPDHLAFYGMNKTQQHVFKIVRIDRVALGVGPEFGPVNALVLNDENSEFGVLGHDWAQMPRGPHGEGLWHAAVGVVYFMSGVDAKTGSLSKPLPPPLPPSDRGERMNVKSQGEVAQEPEIDSPASGRSTTNDEPLPIVHVVERDGDRVTRAMIRCQVQGRTPAELIRHFAPGMQSVGRGQWEGDITNMETLVSAVSPMDRLEDRMNAAEVYFNLPEGSSMRAEFSGSQIESRQLDDAVEVVVTSGKLELIDAGGVVRAWAAPVDGTDQLVVHCKTQNDEVVMILGAKRTKQSPNDEKSQVQVVMNVDTGAAKDENQPPHGAIRYEIIPAPEDGSAPLRMKMKWHYDLKRLAEEAEEQTGKSVEDLLFDDPPQTKLETPDDWGPKPEKSDLRLRLTLLDENPQVGQPLRLRLEIKNFGDKPYPFDPQYYEPFRVLKATRENGQSDTFIGMTPQTSGESNLLGPGKTMTLWDNEDVSNLYLLDEGKVDLMVAAPERMADRYPSSNKLSLTIGAGKQSSFRILLKNVGQGLPEKWNLANGMSLGSGWKGLFLSYLPTDLKRDSTGIQIWFTDKKLPDDYELGKGENRQIISYLGHCGLGYLNVAAAPKASEIWPGYLDHIRQAANEILESSDEKSPNDSKTQSDRKVQDDADRPWIANGTVTGADGKPLAGVTVHAHCGVGTLRETGSAVTDTDGKYELRFGPGIWFKDKKGVQAATISIDLDGYFEKNLYRQGDKVAAYELPEGDIGWGDKKPEDVFLPNQPQRIDFVMLPATRIRGMVVDADGNRPAGVRVSLTGDELPPSSNVVDEVRTNENGEFEIGNIPTGYKFQIMVEPAKAQSPWLAWASPPIEFRKGDSEDTYLKYSIDGQPVDFSCQRLNVTLRGQGTNWKSALKEAADQKLELKWDGLSTANNRVVRASMAHLEIGATK